MNIDAVSLEVFRNLFSSIAEEMGVALGRTAWSPNIKERRDYSCAIFDAGRQDHCPSGAHTRPPRRNARLRASRHRTLLIPLSLATSSR